MFSRIKSSAGSIKTKDMIEYILLFIGAVIMFYKSFMGINIGDEVFYLELMHRFAQGDCPFLHEWHPTQIYAIMLYPLYVLYVFLKGSNNGIILAGRLLMNSITLLTALIIYGILKRGGISTLERVMITILQLFYSCNGILGLSYYMVAYEALLLVLALQYYEKQTKHYKYLFIFLKGFFLSLAVCCNPFLSVFLGLKIIWCLCKGIKSEHMNVVLFLMGIFSSILWIIVVIFSHGGTIKQFFAVVPELLHDSSHSVDGNTLATKVYLGLNEYFFFHGYIIIGAAILVMIYRVWKKEIGLKWKRIYFAIQTFYMCMVLGRNIMLSDNLGDAIFIISFYFVLLIPIADITSNRLWIDVIGAGIILMFSFFLASNQPRAAGSSGAIIVVIGGASMFRSVLREINIDKKYLALGVAMVMMPVCIVTVYWKVYTNWNDKFSFRLPEKVACGPARGLYTTEEHKKEVEYMCELAGKMEDEGYLVTNNMLLYLTANLRCGMYSAWYDGIENQAQRVEQYYSLYPERKPNYIVAYGEGNNFKEFTEWQEIDAYEKQGEDMYQIFQRMDL